MPALASYAKQAQDRTLLDTATRIKARAIQRCGELLKQIERGSTAHRRKDGGDPSSSTRKGAASAARLSERQRKNALRAANIDPETFEAWVEAEHPPGRGLGARSAFREAADLRPGW